MYIYMRRVKETFIIKNVCKKSKKYKFIGIFLQILFTVTIMILEFRIIIYNKKYLKKPRTRITILSHLAKVLNSPKKY